MEFETQVLSEGTQLLFKPR